MECDPQLRALVVRVAWPLLFREPEPITVAPSLKSTVPLDGPVDPAPLQLALTTVAVNVTVRPHPEAVLLASVVVVLALLTVLVIVAAGLIRRFATPRLP